MDKPRQKIEAEVERTLGAVDDIQRVDGNPYLYTRIQERMQQQKPAPMAGSFSSWRMALATLLLVANISSAYFYYQKSVQANQAVGIEAIASEYGLDAQESTWETY